LQVRLGRKQFKVDSRNVSTILYCPLGCNTTNRDHKGIKPSTVWQMLGPANVSVGSLASGREGDISREAQARHKRAMLMLVVLPMLLLLFLLDLLLLFLLLLLLLELTIVVVVAVVVVVADVAIVFVVAVVVFVVEADDCVV
jgi:hypothetical protein